MTLERVKFTFVALFFAILALVGLSAGADYGLPCDCLLYTSRCV